MPELPDIVAYLTALAPRVVGKPLEKVRIASPLLLRTAVPPIQSIEGRVVKRLSRLGKRIVFMFDDASGDQAPVLVLHLMIAGRLHWRERGAKVTARNTLAAFDFPDGSLVLTEAGGRRRASLHVVRGEAALAELDPGGADVFALSLEQFRAVLIAENHTLKRSLTDPRVLSGIGNAYSDEILWAAKLSPLAQTRKLTDVPWERLYGATRETLQLWVDRLSSEAEKKFPETVTAFRPEMAVHGRYGLPCPRCGAPIQRIRYASNETNYCPICQTEGKVLADRSLSRLLGADWPRTLEELEALKRK
ncbi:MAG TPA: DNA-formamidopyrimidine glycosylase family protein [Candidatus Aquilonibacter sp.]|nr:DNA-formamidopyrimidine glycosylase family protein [Candidatus Aquilonibacter sp.]